MSLPLSTEPKGQKYNRNMAPALQRIERRDRSKHSQDASAEFPALSGWTRVPESWVSWSQASSHLSSAACSLEFPQHVLGTPLQGRKRNIDTYFYRYHSGFPRTSSSLSRERSGFHTFSFRSGVVDCCAIDLIRAGINRLDWIFFGLRLQAFQL